MPWNVNESPIKDCRLLIVVAVIFILIMSMGCGPEGSGGDAPAITGSSSGNTGNTGNDPNAGDTDNETTIRVQNAYAIPTDIGQLAVSGEVFNFGDEDAWSIKLEFKIFNADDEQVADMPAQVYSHDIAMHPTSHLEIMQVLKSGETGLFYFTSELDYGPEYTYIEKITHSSGALKRPSTEVVTNSVEEKTWERSVNTNGQVMIEEYLDISVEFELVDNTGQNQSISSATLMLFQRDPGTGAVIKRYTEYAASMYFHDPGDTFVWSVKTDLEYASNFGQWQWDVYSTWRPSSS